MSVGKVKMITLITLQAILQDHLQLNTLGFIKIKTRLNGTKPEAVITLSCSCLGGGGGDRGIKS